MTGIVVGLAKLVIGGLCTRSGFLSSERELLLDEELSPDRGPVEKLVGVRDTVRLVGLVPSEDGGLDKVGSDLEAVNVRV